MLYNNSISVAVVPHINEPCLCLYQNEQVNDKTHHLTADYRTFD